MNVVFSFVGNPKPRFSKLSASVLCLPPKTPSGKVHVGSHGLVGSAVPTAESDHRRDQTTITPSCLSRPSVPCINGVCGCPGRGDLQPQLDSAMQDVSDKYLLLEETEKQAVRKALVEERGRFCCFVSLLRPVVVSRSPTRTKPVAPARRSAVC